MTSSLVETKYGQVKGEKNDEVFAWKGIPYAKAPVGELRFCPPQPPVSWDGVLDATAFGPQAMQPSSEVMGFLGSGATDNSEDCLYLNIWSKEPDDGLKPVMVWIHGGAFSYGSGASGIYDGTSFASQGDVVVVTINYRLGVMGFLHLGGIGGEEYATSGNCGILDQVAALKWVKENIQAFGGDPDRVTIFGESAGAMSIGTLLAMPDAKGLFNQAILQSGATKNVLSGTFATKIATGLLKGLGMEGNDVSKLKDIPAEKLIEASKSIPPMALGPVVDGVSIPEQPEDALAKGYSKEIPILIGTNKDEYRLFTFFDPTWKQLDEEGVRLRFEQTFGAKWSKVSSQIGDEELTQELYENLMTLHTFTLPAKRLAEIQVEQGAPVWMYRFDWKSPVLDGGLKACHALEIPFVWNTIHEPEMAGLLGDSPDENIASQMHRAWIAFAHRANPNTGKASHWPKYNIENGDTMVFNSQSTVVNNSSKQKLV